MLCGECWLFSSFFLNFWKSVFPYPSWMWFCFNWLLLLFFGFRHYLLVMVGWWYSVLAQSVIPVVFAWYWYGLSWSDGLVIIWVVSVQVPVCGCGAPAVVSFASRDCDTITRGKASPQSKNSLPRSSIPRNTSTHHTNTTEQHHHNVHTHNIHTILTNSAATVLPYNIQ